LNLTRKDYVVDINGKKINPREVLLKTLDPIVDLQDKDDAVLLRVIVSGEKDGEPATYQYEMTTVKDRKNDVTAMARAADNTISGVAQMLGNVTNTKRGVYPREQIVPGKRYIDEMKKRDVNIKESSTVKKESLRM